MMDKAIFWLAVTVCFSMSSTSTEQSTSKDTFSETGPKLIDFICLMFGIPREDCTCKNLIHLNLTLGNKTVSEDCAELDRIDKDLNANKTVLNYVADASRSYAAITVAAWLASIIGNGLVIAVSWTKRHNISDFSRIIALLALCDVIFSCLECIRVFPSFWTSKFQLGTLMCKFLNGGTALGANIAVGLIVIISVDRYFGIVYPLKYGLTRLMVNILLVVNVLVAVGAVVPLYVFYTIDSKIKTCRLEWPNDIGRKDSRIYHWFQLSFYTILPCTIICVLYTMIVISLSRVAANGEVVFHNSDLRRQRLRDNRRVTAILFAVVLAFMFLVTPYRVVVLYFDMVGANEDDPWLRGIDEDLYFGLSSTVLLYPLHVAVNPIIYCAIDAKWREDVRRVLGLASYKNNSFKKSRSKTLSTTISNPSPAQRKHQCSPRQIELANKTTLNIQMENVPRTSDSSGNSILSECPADDVNEAMNSVFSSDPGNNSHFKNGSTGFAL